MSEYKKAYNAKEQYRYEDRLHPVMALAKCKYVGKWVEKLNSARLACEKVISVNQFAKGEEQVKCTFLAHPKETKSDGFILQYVTGAGTQVFTVDGGLSLGDMQKALLNLRRRMLEEAGLAAEVDNRRYKLDISLLISHFHIDHVNELISHVIPLRKFIRVQAIYHAADTAMSQDARFNQLKNGDHTNRPRVMRALRCYQPGFEDVELSYGETMEVKTITGKLTLFAPSTDWGTMENARLLEETYYQGSPNALFDRTPVGIGNNNSLWMKAEYAGHSMLFTGDVMKRKTDRFDEAVDHMIGCYGEKLRSDVIKHPHHGVKREGAYLSIRDHLITQDENALVVLTGSEAPGQSGVLLDSVGIRWADVNSGDLTVKLTKKGVERGE